MSSSSSSSSRASTLALSLLLLLAALQPQSGASFLFPVTLSCRHVSWSPTSFVKTWSSAAAGQPESASEGEQEENQDDGRARSPAGLTLEGVYKRLKLETQGRADGVVGLESKDTDYGIEIVKVEVRREPSLGLQLEEVARGGDGRGLVLVAGVEPGGNAEASGKIFPGDTLCSAGVEGDMSRVEALDWDQTVGALGSYGAARRGRFFDTEVVLVMKRLVKREAIKVQFELPGGSREYDIKAGSNLRGEMMRLDVPVYDPQTLRYDQPYATGNCAGEGTCGTCFVEVQEGAELLTPPDREELMLLSRGKLPVRWRLSCKLTVGKENKPGVVKFKAVPQAEWRSQRTT
ncbi:unnamed protein product [Pylaiella littoralis]